MIVAAVPQATILHNIIITEVLDGRTTDKRLFCTSTCSGKVLNFGCDAYVCVYKPNEKSKITSSSILGACSDERNRKHRVYLSRAERVVTTKKVKLNKQCFHLHRRYRTMKFLNVKKGAQLPWTHKLISPTDTTFNLFRNRRTIRTIYATSGGAQNIAQMDKLEADELISGPQLVQNEKCVNNETNSDNDQPNRNEKAMNERRYPQRTYSPPVRLQ